MSKKISRGICQICGVNGELSFEHIPPRKAFNDRPVRRINFKDIDDIELGPNAKPKGKIEQKGQGDYTLCPSCNNNTGSWYGDSFIVWCYQAMDFLQLTLENDSQETLQLGQQTYNIYPLRVLKQIISMFFSVSGKNFHSRHEGLVKFILNKEAKYLPPKYRFFIYNLANYLV